MMIPPVKGWTSFNLAHIDGNLIVETIVRSGARCKGLVLGQDRVLWAVWWLLIEGLICSA